MDTTFSKGGHYVGRDAGQLGKLLAQKKPRPSPCHPRIHILNGDEAGLHRYRGSDYHIGRVVFEFQPVPAYIIAAFDVMDELWVPAAFHRDSLVKYGFDKGRVHVIPEAVDSSYLVQEDAATSSRVRQSLPPADFVFLSVGAWYI